MKKTLLHFLRKWLFIMAVFLIYSKATLGQEYSNGMLQGAIRVKIKPEIVEGGKFNVTQTKGVVKTGIASIDQLCTKYSVNEMVRVFPYNPKYESKHIKHGLNQWYIIKYNAKEAPLNVVKYFSSIGEVAISEPILEKVIPTYKATEAKMNTSKTNSFNDPYLGYQWHYNNTGQEGGKPGADINLFKAWELTAGNKNVIVSVHDEGVDYSHEDLAGNMWVNEAELNGTPNYDDDGNGYRDDIYGFNFASYTGSIDKMSHGTHVAGTIAAVNNNGIGVSGVAGGSGNNDGVRIMSCQILGGAGGVIEDSYVYAADNGSVISQNSWGYTSPGYIEQAVLDAINYFIKEAGSYSGSPMKGGVVIFAAGNSGSDLEHWPGYYENCISVAALNNKSGVTAYSNYGAWVDIAAPGGEQKTTNKESILSTLPDNRYGYMDGTSMACPHVSGVAALIASKFASSSFTNEDLKKHLLTGTYNIDTLAVNDGFQGKIGIGRTDAVLALADDNKISPNKIEDFSIIGISQDFANLEWTVPTDNDDRRPVSFKIYYSTEELTESTLVTAKKVAITNKNEPGQKQAFELEGLKPVTIYWLGITSVDRWGNESELSNIVKDTTNSGPIASANPTAIQINVDVATNPTALSNIIINNTGAGILKWTSDIRLVKNIDASSIKSKITYPKIATNLNIKPNLKSAQITQDLVTPFGQKPDDQNYYFYDPWNYFYILGEVDTTLTNSSATRFHVVGDAGFNLTDVMALVKHNPHKHNAILEIYKGKEISSAQLMLAQEFTSWENSAYNHSIKLDEQLLFQKDDYFWVVIHVPSGHKYPLGAGIEVDKNSSNSCFFSIDLGKTWKMLEDVYFDNRVVWAVHVLSKLQPLDQYLTLTPDNGVVQSQETQTTEISTDATNLIDGYYKSNVVLQTNDPANPLVRVPVELNVSGHKPILTSPEILEFGSVLYGLSLTKEIEIKNLGYAKFGGGWTPIKIEITDDQFEYTGNSFSSLEPLTNTVIKFKFTPKKVGNANARVTLSDKKGNSYSFNLFGVSAEPPKVEISPADTSVNGLALGNMVNGKFKVKNTGAYPLKYYVSGFATGENLSGLSKYTHKFGYVYKINDGSQAEPAFVWEDISTSGVDLSSKFINNSSEDYTIADLGFKFPFFGKEETSVYVTKHGVLTFDKNSYFNTTPMGFKNYESPDRMISAWGIEFDLTLGGKIYYKRYVDRFIAQYSDVNYDYIDEDWNFVHAKISFQIVLHDNGDINIYYKDLAGIPANETGWALIDIEDQNIDDGLLINEQNKPINAPATGMSILIENPGFGSVKNLTNSFGTVQVGDSVQLNYSINTTDLYVGDFKERISVLTNDPFTPVAYHFINLNITSGGEDTLVLSDDTLKFEKVFQRDIKKLSLIVENQGKGIVSINSAAFKNGHYTIDGELPVTVKPGSKVYYQVQIDTKDLGAKTDTLTLIDNYGDSYIVTIDGEVIDAPVINVDITEIDETLNYGQKKVIPVTISNTGGNPLDVKVFGNEWMNVITNTKGGSINVDDIDYDVLNNYDGFIHNIEGLNPIYNWVDICESGTRPGTMDPWDPELYWWPIDIPFTFSYYGKQYNSIYIGYNGIISFTKQDGAYPMGPEVSMPSTEGPNNFVAPLWVFASESSKDMYPKTGIYYQIESDRVIIQYQDFINYFGMGEPISFEVILYKNGNIKFQYKLNRYDTTSGFGAVGMENEDGTKGYQICSRQLYLFDKQAIMFTPGQKVTVPAGENKIVNVELDATKHWGGTYNGNLVIVNNSPDSSRYEIKATLNIIGDVTVEKPDSIDFGKVTILADGEAWPPFKTYSKEFDIKNIGSQDLLIDAISLTSGGANEITAEIYQYDESGWFPGWVWNPIDWAMFPAKAIPTESIKIRVNITPTGAITEALDTLVFNCNYGDGTIKVPISAVAIEPPVMAITPEEINVMADTKDHKETKTVIIDNYAGKSDLTYNLNVVFDREVSTTATVNSVRPFANTTSTSKLVSNPEKVGNTKSVKADNYNRVLEYDNQTSPATALGYGGDGEFATATKFVAPANGFNLTHIETFYVANQLLNSRISISILAGSTELFSAKEIYSQTFDYNITNPEPNGTYITIPLTKNQIFFPNETFFVSIKYPIDAKFPQGCSNQTDVVAERFYFGNGSNWWDITTTDFKNYGWMVKAAEENFVNNAWVVLESAAIDTVKPGESKEVNLTFQASFAKTGINTARMEITSNDALKSNAVVSLNLFLNSGPVINGGKSISISMNEGDSFEKTYTVKDLENNTYSLTYESKPSFITMNSGTNALTIKATPGLNDAGDYTMIVKGTDSFGNTSETVVEIVVSNKNQAPQLIQAVTDKQMGLTDPYAFIDLSSVFTDPDGDELKYSISSTNSSVVDLFLSSTGLLVKPISNGATTVTLTATDPLLAKATTSWNINVLSTGIDNNLSETVSIYPTVTSSKVYVKLDKQYDSEAIIEVFNSIGSIQNTINANGRNLIDVDLTGKPAGIYLIKVRLGNQTIVGKVIKN